MARPRTKNTMEVKTVGVDSRKLWMSRQAAAEYLGVSTSWLEACETAGLLNVSQVRNKFFYIKSQIDSLIVNGAKTGKDKFRSEKATARRMYARDATLY